MSVSPVADKTKNYDIHHLLELTRTLHTSGSISKLRVQPITPNLLALYAERGLQKGHISASGKRTPPPTNYTYGTTAKLETEAVLIMTPPPRFAICSVATLVPLMTAVVLMSMIRPSMSSLSKNKYKK